MSLYAELKRRNVIRVAAAYIVAAWLLIQVAETIFPLFGFGDTPARLVVIILAIGFIPSMVVAWVFELTPQGLRRDEDVDRDQSVTRSTGKRLDRIILVVLAVALAYFAFDRFVLVPAQVAEIVEETAEQARTEALVESYGDKSIAVLPFVNMSDDAGNEYFSDGISEELLNLLARVPGLRVTGRTSSFSYKGKDFKIADVARDLKVGHVLEGSVRKSGNRVRITVQLIEARSDTHLWSETYDRELDDVFAIQDEVAQMISTELKMKLKLSSGEPVQPQAIKTTNTDAYIAYLQGRELIRARGRPNMERAIGHLERALSLDEGFAPAHAHLAIATLLYHGYYYEGARQTADLHLNRAQQLEPDLVAAHAGQALLALGRGELEAAVRHARDALVVNPNYVDAMNWLRIGLARLGRAEEAEAVFSQMLQTDPKSPVVRLNYMGFLQEQGQYDKAHELADQILSQELELGYRLHAQTFIWFEARIAEGLSWALRVSATSNDVMAAFLAVGEYEEARRTGDIAVYHADLYEGKWDMGIQAAMDNLRDRPGSGSWSAYTAQALYYARRFDEALTLYERALKIAPDIQPKLVPGWWSLVQHMRLAFVRLQAGNEEGVRSAIDTAGQALQARRKAGERNAQLDLAEAMIATLEGNEEQAVKALRSAVQGGLWSPWFVQEPIFDELRGNPGYAEVMRETRAKFALEREKVLQLVCFNNPVPDEWQPLPETCEGVVEQAAIK